MADRCNCLPKTCTLPIKNFCDNNTFEWFIQITIFLNSIALGSEFYEQPEWLTKIQNISNMIFTIIFSVEMILKLIGYGFLDYIRDWFNMFDGVIVILSWVEFILALTTSQESSGLSVLRGFRLLRVFKLVRGLEGIQKLVAIVLAAMTEAATLGMLIILFLFINALVGKQVFPA